MKQGMVSVNEFIFSIPILCINNGVDSLLPFFGFIRVIDAFYKAFNILHSVLNFVEQSCFDFFDIISLQ